LWQFALYLSGGGAALLAMYALCVICGVLLRRESTPISRPELGLLVLWLFFPVAVIFAISWIKPLFLPRFLIICLPAWCLLAAAGLAAMRPRAIGTLIAALLVALSIPAIGRLYAAGLDQPNEDWRGATAYVLQRSQPADGAIFYSSQCRMPFDFYAAGAPTAPRVIFPAHEGQLTYLDFMGKPNDELLSNVHQQFARVWLVMCHNELPTGDYDAPTRSARARLQSQFQLASSKSFPGIQVEEYAKSTDRRGLL
jgi:hypothetical protein